MQVRNISRFNDFCRQVSVRLYSSFRKQLFFPRYKIFKTIPHRRVTSKNAYGKEEIFDLYQLGIFSFSPETAPSVSIEKGGKVVENLEIVELLPRREYQPHYHKNSTAVIYIILGSGIFILERENIEYNASQRIFIPAGAVHGFRTSTRTLFLSIQSPPIIDPMANSIDIYY